MEKGPQSSRARCFCFGSTLPPLPLSKALLFSELQQKMSFPRGPLKEHVMVLVLKRDVNSVFVARTYYTVDIIN